MNLQVGFCRVLEVYEVGFIFLVPPKGHQVYTLTNIKKEPNIHSPKTVQETLLHVGAPSAKRVWRLNAEPWCCWLGGVWPCRPPHPCIYLHLKSLNPKPSRLKAEESPNPTDGASQPETLKLNFNSTSCCALSVSLFLFLAFMGA